jgi:hypothetical protein
MVASADKYLKFFKVDGEKNDRQLGAALLMIILMSNI